MKVLDRFLYSILISITCSAATFSADVAELDSCVILYQYDNIECTGDPIGRVQFTTASQPGSLCEHDESMEMDKMYFSVGDQYCTEDGDGALVFKQSLYAGKNCEELKDVQEIRADTCTLGSKLETCIRVPCEQLGDEL